MGVSKFSKVRLLRFFYAGGRLSKDFVFILSRIQISQISWSRVTEDSKNNKNGDILNNLVKQLWSFFAYSI